MPNTNKNTPMPQCDKNAVSGSFFSVYCLFDGIKMWYSLIKNENGSIHNDCVSHHYRRMTYTSNLLKDVLSDLQKTYPKNEWHFEEVL